MFPVNYISALFDLVYPRLCFSCDYKIINESEKYICYKCLDEINLVSTDRCRRCGIAQGTYSTISQSGCVMCKNVKLMFDGIYAVNRYAGAIRNLIKRFKYNGIESLSVPLGNILIEGTKGCDILNEIDIIAPVPLFWRKRVKRGFNQSAILAKRLAKHYSIPLSIGNLYRTRNTATQTQLSRTERLDNVEDAFAVKKPEKFDDRTILLVDDVMTTGITASECAYELKESGAKKVFVIILARVDMI